MEFETTDVVVVGSGAAGLAAALTAAVGGARVIVLEKAAVLGGTTAMSGAGVWIPANHHMRAAGIEDSPDEALDLSARHRAARLAQRGGRAVARLRDACA